jgi:hypothetical protein
MFSHERDSFELIRERSEDMGLRNSTRSEWYGVTMGASPYSNSGKLYSDASTLCWMVGNFGNLGMDRKRPQSISDKDEFFIRRAEHGETKTENPRVLKKGRPPSYNAYSFGFAVLM